MLLGVLYYSLTFELVLLDLLPLEHDLLMDRWAAAGPGDEAVLRYFQGCVLKDLRDKLEGRLGIL